MCQVVGCNSPSNHLLITSNPLSSDYSESAVCDDHWEQLQQGVQWAALENDLLFGEHLSQLRLLEPTSVTAEEIHTSSIDPRSLLMIAGTVFGTNEVMEVRILVPQAREMAIMMGLLNHDWPPRDQAPPAESGP